MRISKTIIIWASTLSAVSLCISVILHLNSFEYVSHLIAGIFASGILTLFIAIINYWNERKRTLEKFYSYGLKAVSNFNRFENEGNLECSIDSVLAMEQFDYTELDSAYGDIDFIFNNKKTRGYIYKSIYEPIKMLRILIKEKCSHFNEYKRSENGNTAVMQDFITEIDGALIQRYERGITYDDGTTTKISCCHNKIVKTLSNELTGKFYEILYPHFRGVIDNAD